MNPALDQLLKDTAARVTMDLVEQRSRIFEKRPALLDAIREGLSTANGEQLVAAGRELIASLPAVHDRRFALGGETRDINAAALILLGQRKIAATQDTEAA